MPFLNQCKQCRHGRIDSSMQSMDARIYNAIAGGDPAGGIMIWCRKKRRYYDVRSWDGTFCEHHWYLQWPEVETALERTILENLPNG